MYYAEFYSRKPGVSAQQFSETVKRTHEWWAANNPEDRPVLAMGRTWRLGGPHYVVVWKIDSAARLDEWNERRRTDPEARKAIEDWLEVVDCDAGLYEDFGEEML